MIRQAEEKDLEAIYEIAEQLEVYFCKLPCASKGFIQQRIKDESVWVFDSSGIKGFVTLEIFEGNFFINSLAVKDGFHKDGIGSTLLKFVIEKWEHSVYRELVVGTFEEYGVKDFYFKYGFMIKDIFNDVYNDNKRHKVYLLAMYK